MAEKAVKPVFKGLTLSQNRIDLLIPTLVGEAGKYE
jgi:hypothetical protein